MSCLLAKSDALINYSLQWLLSKINKKESDDIIVGHFMPQ